MNFFLRDLYLASLKSTGDAGIVGFGGENRQREHRSGP
jgi:hypothetical protein